MHFSYFCNRLYLYYTYMKSIGTSNRMPSSAINDKFDEW